MGIRYYGWPLRTQADFERAVDDPCATSYALDRREAAIDDENCVGLDKGFRVLLDYFLRDWMPGPSADSLLEVAGPPGSSALATMATPDRCHCIDERQINVLPRAGALLLLGDVLYSDGYASWKPYYGIVPAEYVRLAADDYARVDLAELEKACGEADGLYCSGLFEPFREAIQRFTNEGAGFFYSIR
ncbi:hypothetical protein [Pseudoclavibacter sp. RFBB5]|uniref:hypothetical protein n=1 Tax=Pseudoclavibacter sp. RFBB5 TaxID=2080574 RepID=UPI000CE84418|nr:hypothetical protein [Pseudoclavibacter sp. RFBB5]PPG29761.1 hypothetical protein C5B97_12455 [Pseudoclavibacter sp. RFBB5]